MNERVKLWVLKCLNRFILNFRNFLTREFCFFLCDAWDMIKRKILLLCAVEVRGETRESRGRTSRHDSRALSSSVKLSDLCAVHEWFNIWIIMKARDDITPHTLTPPKSPQDDTPKYDRTKVREFLETLYLKLKGLCDSIESKIEKDLNNYDYERKCFTVGLVWS